ncbi:hypothetical protein AVEN_11293-1 [Araneus ventricosus]|uniref:Mariner Mos1 transposase n=1 Tax=Araneus ventricosus TaxID=182803 RepID=A0A4Y2E0N3_ARAVE|nr:hypothetical protein AVEN_11293-1 [Araneus ventricosus]
MELHQDEGSSHTSQFTVNFLAKIEQEIGTKAVSFTNIPEKSPEVSPTDFCVIGLLKCALTKRRHIILCGRWKAVLEEWDKIPPRYYNRHYNYVSYDVERQLRIRVIKLNI